MIAAAAAFAFVTLCLFMGPEGYVSAWAVAASVSSAALAAGLALTTLRHNQLARPRTRRRPLAGPKVGAHLPR
jgi:hypothetical protein